MFEVGLLIAGAILVGGGCVIVQLKNIVKTLDELEEAVCDVTNELYSIKGAINDKEVSK